MTDFSDRERGEEAKFAHDEKMAFRILARRNRLLGHWAAEKMGLTAEETDAYAKEVVQADFEEGRRRGRDPQGARRLTGRRDRRRRGRTCAPRSRNRRSRPAAS